VNTETDKEIPISAIELQLELSIINEQLTKLRHRTRNSPELKQRGTAIGGIERAQVGLQQAARVLDRQLGQAA
jgi:hypothetical protein